jgi:ABC-type nitrate/sulfonate/bicarbonate transport system permease component
MGAVTETPRARGLAARWRASATGGSSGFLVRWGVLLAVGIAWELLATRARSPFFPPMTNILARARDLWLSGDLAAGFVAWDRVRTDLLPSFTRLALGWLLAAGVGIVAGVVIGRARNLADYVDPLVHFLRAIPPPALIPPFLILLGQGDTMKVALIAFGVVWPILLNTIDGVRSVDQVQLDTGRIYGIDARRRLTHIVLPAATPKIFAGLRISLAIALILMVLSEMVGSVDGIGFGILQAQRSFQYVNMWAGILVLGIAGYAINAGFLRIERRALAWHRAERGGAR